MIIGARLKERLQACGVSQARLAREIGVTPQAISKMVLGDTTDTAKIYQIASFLRTTPEYLTGDSDVAESGVGEKRQPWKGSSPDRDEDLVEVAQIDPRFGAGGVIMDEHAVPERRTFSRTWLRQITTTPPEQLYWARPRGDSMAPTIGDGEDVLIDRRQDTILDADLVWAFAWGDVGAIKRLRPMPDGTVKILSDNPSVPPDVAHDGEVHIFGRVIAVVRRL